MDFLQEEKLLDACILAGKILMENGAEMHRVEDTMNRILETKHGQGEAVSFVIPTGIFVTTKYGKTTKMKRILKRRTNLHQIVRINAFSRRFSQGEIDIDTFYDEIQRCDNSEDIYPVSFKIIAAGFVSAFMMLIFDGSTKDLPIALTVGMFGYFIYLLSAENIRVRFIHEFISAFITGIIISLLNKYGYIHNFDTAMISTIVVLVPGIPIMNSIRDFLVGNTISGTVFLMEAFFIAVMIGAGVMVSLYVV